MSMHPQGHAGAHQALAVAAEVGVDWAVLVLDMDRFWSWEEVGYDYSLSVEVGAHYVL